MKFYIGNIFQQIADFAYNVYKWGTETEVELTWLLDFEQQSEYHNSVQSNSEVKQIVKWAIGNCSK